jgi:hypothetical protein
MSAYPRETMCTEHVAISPLVILCAPLFDIDKTRDRGFDYGAGRAFRSRS